MLLNDTSSARESRIQPRLVRLALTAMLLGAASAHGVEPTAQAIAPPPAPGPAAGLAGSAGPRATGFGTPPQNITPMPSKKPLAGNKIAPPWGRPAPAGFSFVCQMRRW